jgi:hypothetical protein
MKLSKPSLEFHKYAQQSRVVKIGQLEPDIFEDAYTYVYSGAIVVHYLMFRLRTGVGLPFLQWPPSSCTYLLEQIFPSIFPGRRLEVVQKPRLSVSGALTQCSREASCKYV